MTLGIVCTVILGVIALWQTLQIRAWRKAAVDVAVDLKVQLANETLKRRCISKAIADLKEALRAGDAGRCALVMVAAGKMADDDSNETLKRAGVPVVEREAA